MAHAAVTINNHLEILPINETRFKHWLRKIVKKEYQCQLRGHITRRSSKYSYSDAEFDGETKELGLRFAPAPDDNLGLKLRWYYDLTNDEYEFVEITPVKVGK